MHDCKTILRRNTTESKFYDGKLETIFETMLQLADNCKLIRELSGMSQKDFGAAFGATKDMIFSYEKGKAEPSDELIAQFAEILGITTEKFITGKLKADNFDRRKVQEAILGVVKRPKKPLQEDYKDKYIESLEKQVKMLESQLNSVSGQLRHLLFLTLARVSTNQNSLADLLVKQKIEPAEKVEDRLSKENGENYLKAKLEAGIV